MNQPNWGQSMAGQANRKALRTARAGLGRLASAGVRWRAQEGRHRRLPLPQ